MSMHLRILCEADKRTNLSRAKILALAPKITYDDGRTKQSYKDECDIGKIMNRYQSVQHAATHLQKFQGQYADFSDYDFAEITNKLTRGREIFDDLPAETRREFNQSPSQFFAFVNDPKNAGDLIDRLPHLNLPGTQLVQVKPLDADQAAAAAAKPSLDVKPEAITPPPPAPPEPPPAAT